MDAAISAIIGELATRSLSLLIGKYFKPATSKEDCLQRLQWMLLRIRLTVEEAEGRCIRNQAMLQQLNILRKVMYKGFYMLDTFICDVPEEEKGKKDHGVSRSLSLSKFSPAKLSAGSKYDTENIEQMLESLEITVAGMSELVIFLRDYPPMFRQPYSTYLFMEKCMFGRQMEMERVINFLLHEEPPVHCNFGILPIVGPGKVGKTTLVEHVRRDERVRSNFSHVIYLSDNDFREEKQLKIMDGSRIKHQRGDSDEEKFLVIAELVGNIDEGAWGRLHSACQSSIPRGSKVIITHRSENIVNFGTAQALKLKFLSREAYWYFFKALVFGSAEPEEQPRLASIARAIFDEYFDQDVYKAFAGPFIYLNKTAVGLKSSVNVQNWNKILACFKNNTRQNEPGFRKILSEFRMNSDYIFLQRVVDSTQYCVVHNHDRIALVNEEAPKITLHHILDGTGSVRPHGKFDILVWESHLPPYHKYIYNCQIIERDCKVNRKKQGQKRKILS
ncbi:hypothetical protein PAHAL_2G008900 [Panicum hallii]|jgi:hypothetical protein|uniref:NB-ARC domain-containing protein n=1 Tax=Panicum hallii TaxID=206008 RepID=A0A2S3GV74_9POAL|nr:hypothetical protein PAHAL_2G008900 [Panicum hallii]